MFPFVCHLTRFKYITLSVIIPSPTLFVVWVVLLLRPSSKPLRKCWETISHHQIIAFDDRPTAREARRVGEFVGKCVAAIMRLCSSPDREWNHKLKSSNHLWNKLYPYSIDIYGLNLCKSSGIWRCTVRLSFSSTLQCCNNNQFLTYWPSIGLNK